MNIDGQNVYPSLFEMITDTQKYSNQNNIIKFSDNSRCGIVNEHFKFSVFL